MNTNPINLTYSFDDILSAIDNVEQYVNNNFPHPIGPNTHVGMLFRRAREFIKSREAMDDKLWEEKFLEVNQTLRIVLAINSVINSGKTDGQISEKIYDIIKIIIKSEMNLGSPERSEGKDKLWELELYRHLWLGETQVEIEEPDLVVSLGEGLGKYAVACKKIYAENNIERILRNGIKQIDRDKTPGIVAFNLDNFALDKEVWRENTVHKIRLRLASIINDFIIRNKKIFIKYTNEGFCEGVLAYASILSEVKEPKKLINLYRQALIWSKRENAETKERIAAFVSCLDKDKH